MPRPRKVFLLMDCFTLSENQGKMISIAVKIVCKFVKPPYHQPENGHGGKSQSTAKSRSLVVFDSKE